jgi:hypothetical protein
MCSLTLAAFHCLIGIQTAASEDPECVPIANIYLLNRDLEFHKVSMGPQIVEGQVQVFA